MKKIAIFLLVVLLLAGGVAAFAYRQVAAYVNAPVGVPVETFEVKRGASLGSVLEELRVAGVISKPKWVYYWARANKLPALKAGPYEIEAKQSPLEILAMFAEGRVKTEAFTIIPGLNRWQTRDLLAASNWIAKADFDRMCDDQQFLARFAIPGPTCDGYLYPETYKFARGVTPESVMQAIFESWKKNFTEATKTGRGPRNFSPRELMTLASIVEKETGVSGDRAHVACVFYNRLAAKPPWPLATDPTVIYAATLLDPKFDGNIKTWHLHEMESPYNTYRVRGLPPGPISSPGRAAMEAVVSPMQCNDFFFVSMNNGQTVFCPTYECHEAAVQKWQVNYFRKGKSKAK
ncbi:MAG: endolytic transglycosylase MltG [Myxococcota bacterium]|nr:endolytic transglycosylase MltG [Myxococcota bacterium]